MTINIKLEVYELETALQHIAKGAYAEVATLIAKIHEQAAPQVKAAQSLVTPTTPTE